MLNFNSTQFQLLNFNYDSLLDNENALTFDLLGLFSLSPSIQCYLPTNVSAYSIRGHWIPEGVTGTHIDPGVTETYDNLPTGHRFYLV